ncbi:hypothetical protein PG988_013174 [Apiospora saccharicola]
MSKPNGDEPPAYTSGPQQPQPAYQQQQPHPSQQQPGATRHRKMGSTGGTAECRRREATTSRARRWATTNNNPATVPGIRRSSRVTTASRAITPKASTRTSGRAALVSQRPC